jgi:hypothetical protein
VFCIERLTSLDLLLSDAFTDWLLSDAFIDWLLSDAFTVADGERRRQTRRLSSTRVSERRQQHARRVAIVGGVGIKSISEIFF